MITGDIGLCTVTGGMVGSVMSGGLEVKFVQKLAFMQSAISFGSVVLEPSDFFSLLVRRREGLLASNIAPELFWVFLLLICNRFFMVLDNFSCHVSQLVLEHGEFVVMVVTLAF